MKKTVNILGNRYSVYIDVPENKDKELSNRFGYCCPIMRKIVTVDLNTVDIWADETPYSKMVQRNTTLRHEVIHAFYMKAVYGEIL